jgi:hypothetical protein
LVLQPSLVKEDLASDLSLSGFLLATCPEELLLPSFEMIGFVDKGEESSKDADTVERIALRGQVWIWERRVILEDYQTRGD